MLEKSLFLIILDYFIYLSDDRQEYKKKITKDIYTNTASGFN